MSRTKLVSLIPIVLSKCSPHFACISCLKTIRKQSRLESFDKTPWSRRVAIPVQCDMKRLGRFFGESLSIVFVHATKRIYDDDHILCSGGSQDFLDLPCHNSSELQ
eukprot:TRINITY_DN64481_c0_g1_i1.p1 TRINITY_DN64481_c0_g1~~TRINITY_DN64481_c0_g1_i1.p1  ORF type:complete len:106 (-),score=12.73 TRINITY_DN64481_c0_g1_i1:123-440(-)